MFGLLTMPDHKLLQKLLPIFSETRKYYKLLFNNNYCKTASNLRHSHGSLRMYGLAVPHEELFS